MTQDMGPEKSSAMMAVVAFQRNPRLVSRTRPSSPQVPVAKDGKKWCSVNIAPEDNWFDDRASFDLCSGRVVREPGRSSRIIDVQ